MKAFDRLSVLFSFKNEENNLPQLIERTVSSCESSKSDGLIDNYEIIFIDDASTDKSLEIIESQKRKYSSIKVHSTTRSFGNAECLRYAFKVAKGDLIVYLDADLQDPPELINSMIVEMNKSDVDIVYSRRLSRKGEPRLKLIITCGF